MKTKWDKFYSEAIWLTLDNIQLVRIILDVPHEEIMRRAWNQLVKQKPIYQELVPLVCDAQEPYRSMATECLMKMKYLNNDTLIAVIVRAPEPYRGRAWRRLLRRKLSMIDLKDIQKEAPEPYSTRAKKYLKCKGHELPRGYDWRYASP